MTSSIELLTSVATTSHTMITGGTRTPADASMTSLIASVNNLAPTPPLQITQALDTATQHLPATPPSSSDKGRG